MFFDSFICSIRNLGRKKFRSFLTIASISIGVASVVLIASISDIGKMTIMQEMESLGLGSLSISSDTKRTGLTLTAADLELIRSSDIVESAIPIMVEYTDSKMRGMVAGTVVWGTDNGAKQVISLTSKYGRLISKQDVISANKICVVDENLAKAFYKRENIVGKSVSLLMNGAYETFEIVGVVASGGNLLQNMLGEYIPSFVYVPYTTMQTLSGKKSFDQIAVKIEDQLDVDASGEQLVAALNIQAGTTAGYKAENMAKQKNNLNNMLDIVSLVLSAIAGISLIVAGLGIMTVMLVSVNERTREIGIKKSIGASKGTILIEFLIEAFTISCIGSIIGTVIGVGIVFAGCIPFGIEAVFNVKMIAFCILFSIVTGVIFGVYPASVASKLKPVDALRSE